MKIFNKAIIICIVLLADVYDIRSMTTRSKKRMLSEEEAGRKLLGDQKKNRDSIVVIQPILGEDKDSFYRNIEQNRVENVVKAINSTKDTPLKTQKAMVKAVLDHALHSDDECTDITIKNDKNLKSFKDFPNKSRVVSAVANILCSPERKNYAVLDLDHIMKVDNSCTSGKLKITGGHAYEAYEVPEKKHLLDNVNYFFIGADNETIGIDFGLDTAKTVRRGLTKESILNDFKSSKTLVKSSSDRRFQISELGDVYFGTFQDFYNPLIFKTQFPLLVIKNQQLANQDGEIYIGKFPQRNQAGDFVNEHELYISRYVCDSFVKNSRLFANANGVENVAFADITNELNGYFKNDLSSLGLDKFPVPIYGMIDERE